MKATAKEIQKISTPGLVLTGMFTALLCVMAQITIPTQPIPFTLSVFAIFLIGALLPPRYALLSVLAYVLLGAFGLPVFAGMKGGISVVTGMTGGYIMAYPVMSFITALFNKYIKRWKIAALSAGMIVALLFCYALGSLWFSVSAETSFQKALTLCVYPFVVFDLIKIALAVSLSQVIKGTVLKHFNSYNNL